MYYSERNKCIISIFTAALLAAAILLSAFYISLEAAHDCTGEDCPICEFIQQCENVIRQAYNGGFLQAVFVSAIFLYAIDNLERSVFSHVTLVTQKIRLNN